MEKLGIFFADKEFQFSTPLKNKRAGKAWNRGRAFRL